MSLWGKFKLTLEGWRSFSAAGMRLRKHYRQSTPMTQKNTKEIDLVAKLFDEIAPKYATRNGGYTRIVKIGQRKGDGAMEVIIELV